MCIPKTFFLFGIDVRKKFSNYSNKLSDEEPDNNDSLDDLDDIDFEPEIIKDDHNSDSDIAVESDEELVQIEE